MHVDKAIVLINNTVIAGVTILNKISSNRISELTILKNESFGTSNYLQEM